MRHRLDSMTQQTKSARTIAANERRSDVATSSYAFAKRVRREPSEERFTLLLTCRRTDPCPGAFWAYTCSDVLSQTPGTVVSSRYPSVVDSVYAGLSLEILLCVRFVVVVLVLALSYTES